MIIFPMAGQSRRFVDAGYALPKFMLEAHERTLFWHAVIGFKLYFESKKFVFIIRDNFETEKFVSEQCKLMGLKNYQIVSLNESTRGQAETVAHGLLMLGNKSSSPLTIFNIDTFRPNFSYPTSFDMSEIDGYLEVFEGDGLNWSYVLPISNESSHVAKTAEKDPISNLCCTGLYFFSDTKGYLDYFKEFEKRAFSDLKLKELYVAPLYNLLINDGMDIRYYKIPRKDVIFCGIPEEYESFKKNPE
jgi:hypothetical protein